MGKTPKPLAVLIYPPLDRWEEFIALKAQGHTVHQDGMPDDELLPQYDLILGPTCWLMDDAHRKYFDLAIETATRLNLTGERGVALCFDIHVQNGGVKKASATAYAAEVAKLPLATAEVEKRRILARLVAASSNPKYRADVLARKDGIASGLGKVHGESVDLAAWALAGD